MSTARPQHPDFESEQAFIHHAYVTLEAIRARDLPSPAAGGDPKAAAALKRMQESVRERFFDNRGVCFGRIDATERPTYYVGPNLIWEAVGVGDPLVISWASEQAKPFYEATPAEPAGLTLRRRFRTEKDRLLAIADEPFGTALTHEPTIGDFLLEELGRNRTSEMQEIAATIQAQQYRIITRPALSATIVQGGPGTGKTVVGLHRAALLLYRERDTTGSTRVLVVGPNRLFMQYIQYVLPSLGETAADQHAVGELGPISPAGDDDPLIAKVKGDPKMAEVLRRAVADRVRPPAEATQLSHNGVVFEVTAAAVAELIGSFDPAIDAYSVARDRFRAGFDRLAAEAYAARARTSRDAPPALLPNAVPELERARDRIWPAITAQELLRQLLSSEERIERAADTILTDTERRLIYMKPVERIDQVRWTSSDGPLADEMQYLLDHRPQRYWHVVIDEAQDLTPMQLRMIGRRIRDGAATVLGDLAQATGLWKYSTWDEVATHLGLPDTVETEELTLAYRVPREIMAVALPMLDLTAPSIRPPEAFREGEPPQWLEVKRDDLVSESVAQAVAHRAEDGTVAIIAPTGLLDELREDLNRRNVEFGDGETGELAATIELLDPAMSKGLEFDHVYLVEPNMIMREGHEDHRFQELYVALTRATRTLTCIHSEPLLWPLALAKPQEGGGVVADVPPPLVEAERTLAPTSAGEARLSVGEALVLARMRNLDGPEALARALLALAGGADEAGVAEAILSTNGSGESVRDLLAKARELAGGEADHD